MAQGATWPDGSSVLTVGTQTLKSLSTILCLGAHADDIEIGCGGTLLALRRLNPNVNVRMIVFSASKERAQEAQQSAQSLLGRPCLGDLTVKHFRESYFPYQGEEIKEYFDEFAAGPVPQLIFTHCHHDRHQDHRLISELTWNTFRDHFILEYEIPKYEGDLGSPNVFVHLDQSTCDHKVDHVLRCFQSQTSKPWFSPETFRATLRLRGIESRSPHGYAEAFYGRKLVLA
jgi:LmbE family N-acetylglucosaminyl deacetylase